MKRFLLAVAAAGCLVLPAGCVTADGTGPNPGLLPLTTNIGIDEVQDNLSVQFHTDARAVAASIRLDAPIAPPQKATIQFPAGLFDGFEDGGIKSFFRLAGQYTQSADQGAPLLIESNTSAFFNLPRAARFDVTSGTMTVTATGSPLPQIPAGIYTMNFFPGVFNLPSGLHQVSLLVEWSGPDSVTLHKLLLIDGKILPHFGVGRAGDILVNPAFILTNPNGSEIQITASFFTQSGQNLPLAIGESTSNQHVFAVAPGESRRVDVDPASVAQLTVGWATLLANGLPFRAAVVFSNTNASGSQPEPLQVTGDTLRTEAGVASSAIDTRHVLPVSASADGLDTAFAIVNPTSGTAEIQLTFRGDGDQEITQTLSLPAFNQTAHFVTGFFGLAAPVRGSLTITSNADLGVMALRTANGEQTASLPSGVPGD